MQKEQPTLIYANIIRRIASLFLDFIVSDIFFVIILFLIDKVYKFDVISKITSSYLATQTNAAANTSSNGLLGEIAIGFIFVFATYSFLCLLSFGKTAGMRVFGLEYVTSDSQGNPKKISTVQKFSRGVIGSALTLLFAFVPAIVWPFDAHRRNINDLISGTFVMQTDRKQTKTIGAYIFLFILVILYLYVLGIV